MNSIISDIIDRNCAKEEKEKALDLLIEEIEMAKGILSGKYQHCDICNDYYLTKSFWRETKTKRCLKRFKSNFIRNRIKTLLLEINSAL